MNILLILGSAGGIVAILSAIVIIGRGIFKQVNATEDLSEAVKALTSTVTELQRTLNGHETRISVLEDRIKR